jgi:hypothetical protein
MSQCPAGLLGQVSCPSNKGFTAPVCVIALPARSRPSSIAPVRRSRLEAATVSGENEHPGGDQLIADMGGRPGVQEPAVMPAASARMSLRLSAIWRRSNTSPARASRSHRGCVFQVLSRAPRTECAGIIAGSWLATPTRRGEDLIAARESARLQQRQGMIKNIGTQGKG